jgi:NAD(P)-dependent dehydrogenase (short-subunit alcohol dehydrogenase family)
MLVTDIQKSMLEETARLAKQLNSKVDIALETADIRDDGVAEELVAITVKRFGRLDYALNVAGIAGQMNPIHEMPKQNYQDVQDVNAKGVWLCERAQVAQMLQQDPWPTQLSITPLPL